MPFQRLPLRRLASALIICGAFGLLLATRVTTGLQPVRVKVVTAPVVATSGVVRVTVPAGSALLPTPFAFIARMRNDARLSARFDVSVDGRAVCRAEAAANRAVRVDCAVAGPWDARDAHTIDIAGPADDSWALTYLELATHHGASRGYDLVVVPAGSGVHRRATVVSGTAASILVVAIFLLPPARWPRTVTVVHRAAALSGIVLLLAIGASDLVSPYSVLISRKAFSAAVALMAAPRLWRVGQWVWRAPQSRARTLLACAATGLVVAVPFAIVVHERIYADFGGSYSGLLRVSRETFERHPGLSARDDLRRSLVLADGGGYDGQFMYYATFDPFLRAYQDRPGVYRQFIDAPPYRFGRIGFSWLTRALAGDRWRLYPAVMTWTVLSALFLCGTMLALIARARDVNAAWGLLALVVPGFWQSAQFTLPEPIAAGLLLCGYLLILRDRLQTGAVLFAASLLVRETGAVFVALLAAGLFATGRRADAIRLFVAAMVPLVAWRLYVGAVLAPDWGGQAFWFNPGNVGMPFGGFVDMWTAIRQGAYYAGSPAVARAGLALAGLLCFGVVVSAVSAIRSPGVVTLAAFVYGAVGVSLTFASIWEHVGNGQRGTYELLVMLAVLTVERARLPRSLRWGLMAFWIAAGLYTFFGAYDSAFIRNAIF